MGELIQQKDFLMCIHDGEILKLEPWGPHGIRVRATKSKKIIDNWPQALLSCEKPPAVIEVKDDGASISNGDLLVEAGRNGNLSFFNKKNGKLLFKDRPLHPLSVPSRAYRDLQGELYHMECCFEAYEDERIYGLGQHQHGRLDQKGCVIDLIQRNTEVSIPFMLSSRGYGFLWNNPAVGRVEFGNNLTRWVAEASPQIDYWVTTAQEPAGILSNYADVSGHAPAFPAWAAGFWQSKLRYGSQAELEGVAEEYHRRKLPLSVIVIDFFHWTRHGEWRFDEQAWPDPSAMVQKLEKLGVKIMVSVWPSVSRLSENYAEMWRRQYILRNKAGTPAQFYFVDNQSEDGIYLQYYDATHPQARDFIWQKVRQGYYKHGIRVFWLDACEPEIIPFMPQNLRYHAGDGQAVANCYPREHVRGFYEHMQAEGEESPLFLCRSAWAGSQRYGAAVWSGDVPSTFASLKDQLKAGLNMGLSGIPWWNSDIGGFRGGDPETPEFRELLVRWFQFGVFCPVFRLHGHRLPNRDDFNGAANEIWSYGEENFGILKKYLLLRERLRPYIMKEMAYTSQTGIPVMRPLFIDYPDDAQCYGIEDEYLFGSEILVAPVLEAGQKKRTVYLPSGRLWIDAWSGEQLPGGQWLEVDTPLDRIPLYLVSSSELSLMSDEL